MYLRFIIHSDFDKARKLSYIKCLMGEQSYRNNNKLLIINLTTAAAERNSISLPA